MANANESEFLISTKLAKIIFGDDVTCASIVGLTLKKITDIIPNLGRLTPKEAYL